MNSHQPDGKQQKQLTANAGINDSPAISASGQHVVFVSNRTGAFQIWRMNLDGSNQTQLRFFVIWMYLIDERDRVIELKDVPQSSVGAPVIHQSKTGFTC